MNNLYAELSSITRSILDGSRPAHELRSKVLELKSIFEQAGGLAVDASKDIASGETQTSGGTAISPTMAAMCLDDFARRTVQFIRGTQAAILTVKTRPVRVLYAGCGPWAPLAIPLMTSFEPGNVEFRLIDIHSESIDSVRRIVDVLDPGDWKMTAEVADATNYKIDKNDRPDVIVIEMLQAGLESEPQVAVAAHILSQASNSILVPAEVTADLVLINARREFDFEADAVVRDRIPVGRVITIDHTTLDAEIPSVDLELPEYDAERYRPMLCTMIRVYADHVLEDYDSGITCPRKVPVDGELNSGAKLRFSYRHGTQPGIIAKRIA